MEFLPSDEVLAIVVPVAVYWIYSGIYVMLGSLTKYRLHSRRDEDVKNLVSKWEVAKGVLLQQLMQSIVAYLVFKMTSSGDNNATSRNSSELLAASAAIIIIIIAKQFLVGMFVIDTWQYFWHRYMHANKFLYRHIHSWHHRLVVPYSFGSQYNHPIEGLLLDTLGGALAFVITGMTPRTSIFFFSFSAMKGIDDHCGLCLPGNLFHFLFWNNTAYHDVHHQLYGSRYNFSQPFFVTWDKFLGTHLPYTLETRVDGGVEARPMAIKHQ